jgi:hypothetical protein
MDIKGHDDGIAVKAVMRYLRIIAILRKLDEA